jgi:hypothetical protein
VTAASSSYTSMVIGARSHKLQPLFNLVFRRSNIQHPLLMGALSKWRLAHGCVEGSGWSMSPACCSTSAGLPCADIRWTVVTVSTHR